MRWEDAMRANAESVSMDRVSADADVGHSDVSTAWDPYEVWLSRVKRPRDMAARRAATDAETHVRWRTDHAQARR